MAELDQCAAHRYELCQLGRVERLGADVELGAGPSDQRGVLRLVGRGHQQQELGVIGHLADPLQEQRHLPMSTMARAWLLDRLDHERHAS
jgi:hypothetical protein